jgi:hypothetical protein
VESRGPSSLLGTKRSLYVESSFSFLYITRGTCYNSEMKETYIIKAILYVLKPLPLRVWMQDKLVRIPSSSSSSSSCLDIGERNPGTHIDGGMHRPGVMLPKRPRQVFVAELGTGLVDADELELGGTLDGRCWVVDNGRRGDGCPGEAEEDVEELHFWFNIPRL